jgi:hypothetical protein
MDLERLARDTVASVLEWQVDVDALVRTLLHMLRGPHATPAEGQTRTWYAQLR